MISVKYHLQCERQQSPVPYDALLSSIAADWRVQPKRVTAETGSDLSLSCTFQDEDSDKTVSERLRTHTLIDPFVVPRSFNGCTKTSLILIVLIARTRSTGDPCFSMLNR